MDVRLRKSVVFCFIPLFGSLFLGACADRFDTATESGRDALIYSANAHLSRGECELAYSDISKLYGNAYQTEQVQLIMASTYACFAGFDMLTMAANIVGANNFFSVFTKSLPGTLASGHIGRMYQAMDTLTNSKTQLAASLRSTTVNNYMIFIQMGVIGAILSAYGNSDASGNKTTALTYHTPPVGSDLSTIDACALTAAFAEISDSFNHSSFTDGTTTSLINSINSACVTAGFGSCAGLNEDRTLCTGGGADTPSLDALAVVTAVNGAW